MQEHTTRSRRTGHYGKLVLMIALSCIAMYALMYAMVDVWGNVHANWNQLYMAGLMTAAMVLIEIAVMGAMYGDRKKNTMVAGGGVVALVGCWLLVRSQTAISDTQFLKSMIPHHASALLMCKRASIQDADIRKLCEEIVSGQQEQIDLMNAKLRELTK